MKKFLLASILVLSSVLAIAQDAVTESQPGDGVTMSNKIAFYGLTTVGVLFLVMAFRRSKWGKKS